VTAPVGAKQLTAVTAAGIEAPTDMRMGTVAAVSARGVDVSVASGLIQSAAHLPGYNPAVGDPVAMARFQDTWLVLGRPIGPGTAVDNATPGTALATPLLDGMVLTQSGSILATSATTGSFVDVPRYGVSFYHPDNHWVRIDTTYTYFSTVNSDVIQVRVKELKSNTTIGTVEHLQLQGSSWYVTTSWVCPPSLGGATRSYGLQVCRQFGTGNCRLEDHATRRGSMIAYDLGEDADVIRVV
jgi:hypothetical protein